MKKQLLFVLISALGCEALIAQQGPTGNPLTGNAGNPSASVSLANSSWYRGGNNPGGTAGLANIFGTMWNSPIYTYTNGSHRMTVNGNLNYNGGYFSAPGFFGWLTANYPTYTLGAGNKPSGFIGINTDKPQSRLHISGVTTVGPGTGWRPWMQNGVFMNERSNNMYVGMYHLPTASSEDADRENNYFKVL